jgi:unsaturated rhamnogalacturonyl hydrolase
MVECDEAVCEQLTYVLQRQVASLINYQNENGMWHTLIDDPTSYVESSATCGFGYGILRGVRMGLLAPECEQAAWNALEPILAYIGDDGVVQQVSYGTPMGRETKDFYKQIEIKPMPYGQALAMLFLIECMN